MRGRGEVDWRWRRFLEREMVKVDLEFVARQLERVITDMASLKDDMMVVMARLDRIDATAQSLVVEVRAMHSRRG